MQAAHIRNILSRYLKTLSYFGAEARGNILKSFDDSMAAGHDVVETFNYLVDKWGEADPQELIAKYHAKASLDEGQSHFEKRLEYLRKLYKIDSLAFDGLETPKPVEKPKEDKAKPSPAVSLGRAVCFNGKRIALSLEVF